MVKIIEVVDEVNIKIDDFIFNLKGNYFIEPTEFIKYYQNIVDHDNFKISRFRFVENNIRVTPIHELIKFIIYSNVLLSKNINISNLISQINRCRDYYEIRHASSISLFAYIYHREGYNVDFLNIKNNADIIICDIETDIKTAQPPYLKKPKEWNPDFKDEINLRISQMISSRFTEGARQSNMLLFDFSDDSIVSVLTLFTKEIDKIIPPRENRLIICCNRFVPPGEVGKMLGGVVISSEIKKFPDLFYTNGYSIDYDKEIWDFDLI